MAQQSRPGSPVQTHNYPALVPPWQKCSRSPRANDANKAKKRKIELPNTNSNQQPTTQINTHNRFAILESSNDAMEIAGPPPNHHAQRSPPPPPIFVNDIIDIQTMIKSLERDISKEDYNLKITNNQVKILPTNPEAYRKLTKTLRALNANFHTYQLKEERPFRVVLRNIHHSADIDDLKTELSKLGHEVINVSNIRHRVTKDPLSLFFIDLKQKPNNKEIYNTSRLMNAIVKFEPPQIKKELVQCKRCQRYGHTQKYCNHTFRCVKCAGTHPTDQCRKSPETPAKCIHCQGDHPANYKGCSAYKSLYSSKYPKLRTKEENHQTPSSPKSTVIPIPPINQTPSPIKLTTPSNSYAQAVQGTRNTPNSHSDPPQNSAPTSPNTDNVSRLEKLIEKQSEQINNLLSLLTLIMDKLIRPDTK